MEADRRGVNDEADSRGGSDEADSRGGSDEVMDESSMLLQATASAAPERTLAGRAVLFAVACAAGALIGLTHLRPDLRARLGSDVLGAAQELRRPGYITLASDPSLVFSTETDGEGPFDPATRVHLFKNVQANSQKWLLQDGLIMLAARPKLVLSVITDKGGVLQVGSGLDLMVNHGSNSQRWVSGNGSFRLASSPQFCLAAVGGRLQVALYDDLSLDARKVQTWTFSFLPAPVPLKPAAAPAITGLIGSDNKGNHDREIAFLLYDRGDYTANASESEPQFLTEVRRTSKFRMGMSPGMFGVVKSPGGHCLAHSDDSISLQDCRPVPARRWAYDGASGQIQNFEEGCLASTAGDDDDECGDGLGKCGVALQPCSSMNPAQQWRIDVATGAIRIGRNCLHADDAGPYIGLITCPDSQAGAKEKEKTKAKAQAQSWTLPRHVCKKLQHSSMVAGLCIDAPDRCAGHGSVHLWTCYDNFPSQEWVYDAHSGRLKSSHGICMASRAEAVSGSQVFMQHCLPGMKSQIWRYNDSLQLLQAQNGLCMTAPLPRVDGSGLYLLSCNPQNPMQHFNMHSATCTMGEDDFCQPCDDVFRPPEPKTYAHELNGVRVDDVCIGSRDRGMHSVFVIGDWGGLITPEGPVPAKKPTLKREFVKGVDDWAQRKVAEVMRKRAKTSRPDYVLNMGDNFYWSGVDAPCGSAIWEAPEPSEQFRKIFEEVYKGEGLDGKTWLGVLGNHDYGGFLYSKAWDQAIGYTWTQNQGKGGRWLTPAQYWRSRVFYPDFSVDYFFIDSNYQDTVLEVDNDHNICGEKNKDDDSCGAERPFNRADCPVWFRELWAEQSKWLHKGLKESSTDWLIVVSHFPAFYGKEYWMQLSHKYGIDLFLSGHNHDLEMYHLEGTNPFRPTAVVVSGGGGGITSEGTPELDGDDNQYGFFELRLSRTEIEVLGISHSGKLRYQTFVHQRPPSHVPPRLYNSQLHFQN